MEYFSGFMACLYHVSKIEYALALPISLNEILRIAERQIGMNLLF